MVRTRIGLEPDDGDILSPVTSSMLPNRLLHNHWNQLVLALLQVKESPPEHTKTTAGKSEGKVEQ